jgi:protein-S-isoprenylcysteine O-methyltransferase Ste14
LFGVSELATERTQFNRGRLIRSFLAMPVYFALFMFVPAGRWDWVRGWLFIVVFVIALAISSWFLWRTNPEMLIARTWSHEDTKRWDKFLVPFALLALYAIIPVAALDDGRFQWFPVSWWVCGIGYVLFIGSFVLVTWAQAVNKFFEVNVRLQTERGHRVVDRGPYAIIRHPGYVGGILIAVGSALCLGSLWALIPAGLASALLILRTKWEDQTLQEELEGYREYASRVRFRLIPGLW